MLNQVKSKRITSNKILQQINSEIKRSEPNYIAIFDLDDTVFDTSFRRIFIYEQYLPKIYDLPILNPILQKKHYNFIPLINKNAVFQEYRSEIIKFFFKLFLSEQFLFLDRPFPGIKPFLDSLIKLDIPIIYLTGRLASTIRKGTFAMLEKYGLPNSLKRQTYLRMKINEKTSDNSYKKRELKRLINQYPEKKFLIFDNESRNCSMFNESLPNDSIIVRFNSVQKKYSHYEGYLLNSWE